MNTPRLPDGGRIGVVGPRKRHQVQERQVERRGFWRQLRRLYDNTPLPPGQAAGIAVNLVLDRLRPATLPGSRSVHRCAGAVSAMAGFALTVWALIERRRGSHGAFDLEHPESLVTTGPYSISRHPMYVGWWLIHLGIGLGRGSRWVLATVPVAVLAEHIGVLKEEAGLAQRFGTEYLDYAASVPRYLVRRRQRHSGHPGSSKLPMH